MSSPIKIENHETRNFVLGIMVIMVIISIIAGVISYYAIWLPETQMKQKWEDAISAQHKQSIDEKKIIDSENCNQLKSSINNNQFQLEDQYALQHYIGKCT